ncbi:hypothetical protein B0H11DRAFT_2246490 [Mycena galericulata]|nr:hypothetical protein B0H11DRAFT_2246490 [Mycena galericulata]
MSTPASMVAPTSLGPPVSTGVLAVTHPNQPVHRCPPWLAGRSILFTSQVQLSTLSTTVYAVAPSHRVHPVHTENAVLFPTYSWLIDAVDEAVFPTKS